MSVMTSLCYFACIWETVDVCWLLMVILMHVTLCLSKFSIKHYFLTYLLSGSCCY